MESISTSGCVDILQNAKIMTCHCDSTLEQASSKAENLYSDFFFSSTRNSSTQLCSPQRVKTPKKKKKKKKIHCLFWKIEGHLQISGGEKYSLA